ncbi:MAG: hypothetical protein K8F91_02995 [Candidatus Obscuribacterales bacterium]|nr:hypothetical protein [Candidatus Obscuribacterales bacterium]
MRSFTKSLFLLSVLSLIFSGVGLFSPVEGQQPIEANLNTATESWRLMCGGATQDAYTLENRQNTKPAQEQSLQFPEGGALTQGGTGSGGGGGGLAFGLPAMSVQEPQLRENVPVTKERTTMKEGTDYFPGEAAPLAHPGPPRYGIPHNHVPEVKSSFEHPSAMAASRFDSAEAQDLQPNNLTNASEMQAANIGAETRADESTNPLSQFQNAQSQMHGAAQGASESLADAFDPTWLAMLELQMSTLPNVANEATGAPASAYQPIKSHQNAIWFVQRMYESVYIPMAVLLLLPGAVLTQMKGYVSFGILGSSDEDSASPFAGILRGMIAVFLIPATQLILSYTIDVGNSMTYEVSRYVNPVTIFLWADEQVFRAPLENAINQVLDPSTFPVLGKLSQGSEALSGVESQSTATVMLQTLANGMAQSAAFGLVMLCAFQITMVCYLMLLGPIAAALYAWPSGIGQMFNRVFSVWVDAVINLSLWRFWWTVVLLCIDTRLGWLGALGGFSLFSEWELLMFIAFLVILTYVPFNPFDFKAGEMVSQILQKAEGAVGEATQGGKK